LPGYSRPAFGGSQIGRWAASDGGLNQDWARESSRADTQSEDYTTVEACVHGSPDLGSAAAAATTDPGISFAQLGEEKGNIEQTTRGRDRSIATTTSRLSDLREAMNVLAMPLCSLHRAHAESCWTGRRHPPFSTGFEPFGFYGMTVL